MATCSNCSAQVVGPANFCTRCGAPMVSQPQGEILPPVEGRMPNSPKFPNPDQAVAHGFGRVFGLHPGVAFFTCAVNMMLFGKDGLAAIFAPVTMGGDVPLALFISAAAGAVVGYVTYLGQMKWYGDDHEGAKVKGLISGVLTAIPTGLPGILFGSVALAGVLKRGKR
ncbi:MAG TPA: hypothetical protein VMI06_02605 [Terriglobia bacterium]|nr:hypothetical protein [Terriglobia bacterium]